MIKNAQIKNKLKTIPKPLVFSLGFVICFGLLMMYSAGGGSLFPYAVKQLGFILIFTIISILIILIRLRIIYELSYLIYLGCLFLLILVEFIGHKVMGATRWINLGLFSLQPSELMKIGLVLALSRYFHSIQENIIISPKKLIIPVLLTLTPFAVILKQPDLGTAMILISVALVIFFIARVSVWYFFTGFFGLLFLLPFVWRNLHDYQKKRVLMFLNPESDPLGAGYNIIQSKIAIGSGGFFGKGYLAGTQSHLDFLPEHQTDFVFPMFAEEFGFIGSSILIIFYAFICFYSIKIANNSRSFFGKYLTMGLITIFTLHVIVNIGMVTGVLPVVGIPLPFFSYGGTVTASSMIAFSLILNVFASSKNKMPSPI